MILVDSRVGIDYFRSADTPQVVLLDSLFGRTPLAGGDLIAAAVRQGVRGDGELKLVKQAPDAFDHIDLVGHDLAVKASGNRRTLRSTGIAMWKTMDTLMAARCMEGGLAREPDDDLRSFAGPAGGGPVERRVGPQPLPLDQFLACDGDR